MESRFGVKDALILVLLIGTLISVWLSIRAADRQWDAVQSLNSRVDEQANVLRGIARTLERGVVTANPNGGSGGAGSEADTTFARLDAIRENADFAEGDWLIDTFGQTIGKLTPLISTDTYQDVVESYVMESLIVRDPNTLEWAPWVAHTWEVSEDGLSVSFDLRDDVKFSDGEPLDSDDVLFTYEMSTNPDVNAPRLRSYFENVIDCQVEGPNRVVFTLKEPYFLTLSTVGGMRIMARHYYEQFDIEEEYNTSTGLLFGSGPYRLGVDPEEWTSGQSGKIELVRNEGYWGPRPPLDRLIWLEIEDETVRETSLRNGEVDIYAIRAEKFPTLSVDERLLEKSELLRYTTVIGGYRYVGWNQVRNNEPFIFADPRVRRAMTMLTNRAEMAEQLMSGLATISTGPFHYLSKQADPTVEPIAYDPEGAIALLAEAGFADNDGDGVLETPDGEQFRFKLIYPASNPNYEQQAFYLRDAYARAGIILEPDPTEWNTMLQKLDERDFDAITLGWGGVVESDPKQIFHSDNVGEGGDNYIGYVNEDLDALIDEARVTVDEDARNALWHQVHRTLNDDQPYTFLFSQEAVVFVDKRVRNVVPTKVGLYGERVGMYVPSAMQRWTD